MTRVFCSDVAARIGVHKTTVLRGLKKIGVSPIRMRDPQARGQWVSVITPAEEAAFLEYYYGARQPGEVR